MVDSWSNAIDNGNVIGTVFLDLRKAFDLVDHDFLLHKLRLYHFSDTSLMLMKSYLSNRSQCVRVNNFKQSSFLNVSCGVPQGSILGPLLFLIYINDIGDRLLHSSIDLYADDSTLYSVGKDVAFIQPKVQADVDSVVKWCDANNMLIHPKKSKSMVIGPPNKIKVQPKLEIVINNTHIEQISTQKLLGIFIDDNLSWSYQIQNVCAKLKSKISLLTKINNYLSYDMKILFYNSYIMSTMDYCSIVWYKCQNKSSLSKLIVLQKRCAKIILRKPIRTHSSELFHMLDWLSFENRCKYHTAVIVHKTVNNHVPSYIKNILHFASNESYSLRSTTHNDISHKKINTKYGSQTFSHSAMTVWNFGIVYHLIFEIIRL